MKIKQCFVRWLGAFVWIPLVCSSLKSPLLSIAKCVCLLKALYFVGLFVSTILN